MLFGTMDFHPFNAAEHLMGFRVEAGGMFSQIFIDLSTFAREGAGGVIA